MICNVQLCICHKAQINRGDVAKTMKTVSVESGPYDFSFDTDIRLEDIREDFTKLLTFSVQFGMGFEGHRSRIMSTLAMSQAKFQVKKIEHPSFFVCADHLAGIGACVPDKYVCLFNVTWDASHDYKQWFADCDFDFNDDFDEIFGLYRTLRNESGYAIDVRKLDEDDGIEISIDRNPEPLRLTPEEQDKFAEYIDSMFELTVDGEEALRTAMERND